MPQWAWVIQASDLRCGGGPGSGWGLGTAEPARGPWSALGLGLGSAPPLPVGRQSDIQEDGAQAGLRDPPNPQHPGLDHPGPQHPVLDHPDPRHPGQDHPASSLVEAPAHASLHLLPAQRAVPAAHPAPRPCPDPSDLRERHVIRVRSPLLLHPHCHLLS